MLSKDLLRQLALEALVNLPETQFVNLVSRVAEFAATRKLVDRNQQTGPASGFGYQNPNKLNPIDELHLQEIVWDLIAERIVTPGINVNNPDWPWMRLTDFGKLVASENALPYYDPDRYIERLQNLVPDVDSVVVQYLAEALNCFRQRLFFASAVMCGAAAEKVILLLLNSIADYEQNEKKKKEFVSLLERPNLPRIFEAIQGTLDSLKKEIPYSIHQGSSEHLLSLFEMIRAHRNEAVHPNAGTVSKEKIFLALQTMPSALAVVFRLISWFDGTHQKS